MNDLANNGYYIIRNFVPDNLKTDMNINILENDKVNYKNYDNIINNILKKLDSKFNWESSAIKYRVSEGKTKKNI